MAEIDAVERLRGFKAKHEFFIGIDSDGCAFDTMEIKHKECFIPNIIKHWGLQGVSKYARQAAEFVNLYSKWRGINRFPALIKVFDLLEDRDVVKTRGVTIPRAEQLRQWIQRETRLGNPALKAEVEKTGDDVLIQALKWSEAVNATIADMVHGIPPFGYMRESLEKMAKQADLFVVSQTPTEALTREWQEHKIDSYVKMICGQEMGTKTEHLEFGAGDKYGDNCVLMIGDAPGDMKAARANGALFYPINPGDEEMSWQRFYEEALERFFAGSYAGDYERQLIAEFDACLPELPPWKE